METTAFKEVRVPLQEVPSLVDLLGENGCRNVEVIYSNSSTATIAFFDEKEYLIFILGDLLNRAKNESSLHIVELDFAFIARIEKKLRTFDRYNNRYTYRLGKW